MQMALTSENPEKATAKVLALSLTIESIRSS
jgi:hypothetical protein